MSVPNPKPAEDVIREAAERVMELQTERRSHATGLFPDDNRIPREIADELSRLGKLRKSLIIQNQRWREGIECNRSTIAEIEAIYLDLKTEFEIAVKQELPTQ